MMMLRSGALRRPQLGPGDRASAFVALHVRARGMPLLLLGVAVVALTGWAAADWLVHRPWSSGPDARLPVVLVAPLMAAVLASPGLAGAAEELERSMPARWRRYRLVHVVVVALVTGAALALIGTWEPRTYGTFELVRNTFGLTGLVVGAAVVIGARLAWLPAFGYGAFVYGATPRPMSADTAWWAWPLQPWSVGAASLAAAAVSAVGLAMYVLLGARVSRDGEN
ncbi:hypothetical protein [Phytoactinopolyspora endophytica]|uniref:hypothetical protein n=1 Tax=Phytoactinopolyspora endophytica TaxID=1642495 RepID=UPI003B8343AE